MLAEPLPPRCVIVFYPHTSNWDLPIGLLAKWTLDLHIRWVAKDSLFRWPLGMIFRRWGGIPVNRRERSGFTERLAGEFARRDVFRLLIAPEGTRGRTDGWKSGFYHIAGAAQVPIAMAFIDYPRRESGFGGSVPTTGDSDADMARIADFYADKTGRRLERQGPVHIAASEAPKP